MAPKVNLQGKYSEFEPYLDIIANNLREKVAEAQNAKDSASAVKYQDQLWTLKDYKAGCLRNIDPKLLDELFSGYTNLIKKPSQINDNDKRLKTLIKKREQIRALVEKQKSGEKLEKNQLDKISSLPSVDEEIDRLERLQNLEL